MAARDRASNPYGLPEYEWQLWTRADRPTGAEFASWSSPVGAIKGRVRRGESREQARIAQAGKAEQQASHEAWLRYQADRLNEDARITDGLIATAAAVAAKRKREREAWKAQEARRQQLADLGM